MLITRRSSVVSPIVGRCFGAIRLSFSPFAAVREAWMTLAHAPGTLLAARLANGEDCQGRYDGLDADGALLLRMTDGSVRAIHAGDVFQL